MLLISWIEQEIMAIKIQLLINKSQRMLISLYHYQSLNFSFFFIEVLKKIVSLPNHII